MAEIEGGQDYCMSKEDVNIFLTTKPVKYHSPDKTCLLMMTKNESGEMDKINGKNIHRIEGGTGSGQHAEKNALEELRKSNKEMKKKKITEVLFLINYSPCSDCKVDIIKYCVDNPEVRIKIFFAGIYMPPKDNKYESNEKRKQSSLDVLHSLLEYKQIQIQNIYGCYWKSLILAKNPVTDFKAFWCGRAECVDKTMKDVLVDRELAEYIVEKRKEEVNPITKRYEWEEESITSKAFLDAVFAKIEIGDVTSDFKALSLKKKI